ncbi:MAG: sulfatase [Acidobacteriota bacterium]
MKRRSFLAAAAAPLLGQAAKPRNVVLIVVDDLGYKDIRPYGSETHPVPYPTPHLERLASESALFRRFYAACPVCSPTRASILTGKYPVRTGITDWIPGMADPPEAKLEAPRTRTELALEEKTIAEYLMPLGYATASFGIWHLGGDGFLPTNQGFDVNVGGDHKGQPNSYRAPFTMPGLGDAPTGTELTMHLTGRANRWIEEQAGQSKPFFLYLPHFGVHTPLGSDPGRIQRYRDEPVLSTVYAAMVDAIDESVDAIRSQLRRSGVDGNTMIIFTSDNGALLKPGPRTSTSLAPLRNQKGYLHEGGIRVPCLIHDPLQPKPRVIDQPACSIDILPTILNWLGQPIPGGIDGTPIFGRTEQPIYYWHYPHYHGAGGKPGGAILDGDYKLIEDFESGRTELYNLKADIGESRDLSSADPARASNLYLRLRRWREQNRAIMPKARTAAAFLPSPAGTSG